MAPDGKRKKHKKKTKHKPKNKANSQSPPENSSGNSPAHKTPPQPNATQPLASAQSPQKSEPTHPTQPSQATMATSSQSKSQSKTGWESYSLDRYAHDLVLKRKDKDSEVLNQVHKMRSTVAFGLERFWGEQHRLDGDKAAYWKDMWQTLTKILKKSGITLPNDATNLWEFDREHRKIAIAVLTQLCDCAIWWTQRYKP